VPSFQEDNYEGKGPEDMMIVMVRTKRRLKTMTMTTTIS
jgi:hypothetical protein